MSHRRYAPLTLVLGPALLLALMPSACAVGVAPELEDQPLTTAGSDAGGAGKATGGGGSSAGTPSTTPKAGATSASGSSSNPFGGTASSGGEAGSGGGGTSAGGTSAGGTSASGGSAGGGTTGSGGGSGGCTCAKTLTWTDNTVMSWATGDCVTAGSITYVYIGTKAQTYANAQCNPAKQEPWCPDASNDYKFMACP